MNQAYRRRGWRLAASLAAAVSCLLLPAAASEGGDGQDDAARGLEETRLTLQKWMETEEVITRERTEWQQGKEILLGRVELLKNEIAELQEKIGEARGGLAAAEQKRAELDTQRGELVSVRQQLVDVVTAMEADVRRVFASLPEPLQAKLRQLRERIPEDPATERVTASERYQNVLGILDVLNAANNEISVNYEVRTLADGKPSEVRALYIGLAQAYYVSASGEAGIGRPGAEGWTWEPSRALASDVLVALEILQNKHTPEFVPLPVRIQ